MPAKTLFWRPLEKNWYNPATGEFLSPVTADPWAEFVLGTTVPVVGFNVGVRPGTPLVTNTRTSISGSAVEVFENMVFPNKVTINGQNKTFINCKFEGRTGTSECVTAYATDNDNLVFRYCTFAHPADMFPKGYVGTAGGKMGFRGHHVRLIQCAFYNVVDGFRPRRTGGGDADFEALGCHVSNLLFLSPDTGQDNRQSHNDCMQDDQTLKQDNVLVKGCWLNGHLNPDMGQAAFPVNPPGWATTADGTRLGGNLQYPPWLTCNATIQLADSTSGVKENYVFDSNWMFGGSVLINAGGVDNIGLSVINNRVGRDSRQGKFLVCPNSLTLDAFSGNTFYDDGTPANLRYNG